MFFIAILKVESKQFILAELYVFSSYPIARFGAVGHSDLPTCELHNPIVRFGAVELGRSPVEKARMAKP